MCPGSIIFGSFVRLERVFSRAVILAERVAYSRFGVNNRTLSDYGKGYLSRVAQGLKRSGRDAGFTALTEICRRSGPVNHPYPA